MRIVIETNEQGGAGTSVDEQKTAQPSQAEAINAGPPSETLNQGMNEASSLTSEGRGTDAGAPPEWLMEAIRQAVPSGKGDSGMDAGAAPGSQT